MSDENLTKQCSKCKQYKSTTEFCKHSPSKDGLHPICRSCRSAIRKGEKQDPERRRKSSKKYYESHKEECFARGRKWNLIHRDRHLEIKRLAEKVRNSRKRSSTGRGITSAQIRNIYDAQSRKCKYCHAELGGKYHVDHRVPIALGGSDEISNIQILCARCNSSKKATPPEEYERKIGYAA